MALDYTILELANDPLINRLDASEFRFLLHLHDQVDDHGRLPSDLHVLKSRLFPRLANIRCTDISRWIAACEKAGLVRCYVAFNGRNKHEGESFIEILDYKTRKNPKWKKSSHPPPEGQQPLLVSEDNRVKQSRVSGARASGEENEIPFPEASIPTWAEVKAYAEMHAIPETSARKFFDHHENKNLWLNKFDRMIEWKKSLVSWAAEDRQPARTNANSGTTNYKGARRTADRNAGTLNKPSDYEGITSV